ncbi:unnamed protein product [Closterium sp. Naga37s-1]|nr:unnamed protein product [Closterium sp. Naga37s-1]
MHPLPPIRKTTIPPSLSPLLPPSPSPSPPPSQPPSLSRSSHPTPPPVTVVRAMAESLRMQRPWHAQLLGPMCSEHDYYLDLLSILHHNQDVRHLSSPHLHLHPANSPLCHPPTCSCPLLLPCSSPPLLLLRFPFEPHPPPSLELPFVTPPLSVFLPLAPHSRTPPLPPLLPLLPLPPLPPIPPSTSSFPFPHPPPTSPPPAPPCGPSSTSDSYHARLVTSLPFLVLLCPVFPYHLSAYICGVLRISPFRFYRDMLVDAMAQERSYDSLPNITAADIVRVLGVGRNQYLHTMLAARSTLMWRLSRKQQLRDSLPQHPAAAEAALPPWWGVSAVDVQADDLQGLSDDELYALQVLQEAVGGRMLVGEMHEDVVRQLYCRHLVAPETWRSELGGGQGGKGGALGRGEREGRWAGGKGRGAGQGGKKGRWAGGKERAVGRGERKGGGQGGKKGRWAGGKERAVGRGERKGGGQGGKKGRWAGGKERAVGRGEGERKGGGQGGRGKGEAVSWGEREGRLFYDLLVAASHTTTVAALADTLQVPLHRLLPIVSLACRLRWAEKLPPLPSPTPASSAPLLSPLPSPLPNSLPSSLSDHLPSPLPSPLPLPHTETPVAFVVGAGEADEGERGDDTPAAGGAAAAGAAAAGVAGSEIDTGAVGMNDVLEVVAAGQGTDAAPRVQVPVVSPTSETPLTSVPPSSAPLASAAAAAAAASASSAAGHAATCDDAHVPDAAAAVAAGVVGGPVEGAMGEAVGGAAEGAGEQRVSVALLVDARITSFLMMGSFSHGERCGACTALHSRGHGAHRATGARGEMGETGENGGKRGETGETGALGHRGEQGTQEATGNRGTGGSCDSDLKRHAVMLFEAGKLAEPQVLQLWEQLQLVEESPDLAGDLLRLRTLASCLRCAIATLRCLSLPPSASPSAPPSASTCASPSAPPPASSSPSTAASSSPVPSSAALSLPASHGQPLVHHEGPSQSRAGDCGEEEEEEKEKRSALGNGMERGEAEGTAEVTHERTHEGMEARQGPETAATCSLPVAPSPPETAAAAAASDSATAAGPLPLMSHDLHVPASADSHLLPAAAAEAAAGAAAAGTVGSATAVPSASSSSRGDISSEGTGDEPEAATALHPPLEHGTSSPSVAGVAGTAPSSVDSDSTATANAASTASAASSSTMSGTSSNSAASNSAPLPIATPTLDCNTTYPTPTPAHRTPPPTIITSLQSPHSSSTTPHSSASPSGPTWSHRLMHAAEAAGARLSGSVPTHPLHSLSALSSFSSLSSLHLYPGSISLALSEVAGSVAGSVAERVTATADSLAVALTPRGTSSSSSSTTTTTSTRSSSEKGVSRSSSAGTPRKHVSAAATATPAGKASEATPGLSSSLTPGTPSTLPPPVRCNRVEIIRGESLASLSPSIRQRLLSRDYHVIVSALPLLPSAMLSPPFPDLLPAATALPVPFTTAPAVSAALAAPAALAVPVGGGAGECYSPLPEAACITSPRSPSLALPPHMRSLPPPAAPAAGNLASPTPAALAAQTPAAPAAAPATPAAAAATPAAAPATPAAAAAAAAAAVVHYGSPAPALATPWLKLLLYVLSRCGPPTIVLVRGQRLRHLPLVLRACECALVGMWDGGDIRKGGRAGGGGGDEWWGDGGENGGGGGGGGWGEDTVGGLTVVPGGVLLHVLNTLLLRSAVMVQPLMSSRYVVRHIPLPLLPTRGHAVASECAAEGAADGAAAGACGADSDAMEACDLLCGRSAAEETGAVETEAAEAGAAEAGAAETGAAETGAAEAGAAEAGAAEAGAAEAGAAEAGAAEAGAAEAGAAEAGAAHKDQDGVACGGSRGECRTGNEAEEEQADQEMYSGAAAEHAGEKEGGRAREEAEGGALQQVEGMGCIERVVYPLGLTGMGVLTLMHLPQGESSSAVMHEDGGHGGASTAQHGNQCTLSGGGCGDGDRTAAAAAAGVTALAEVACGAVGCSKGWVPHSLSLGLPLFDASLCAQVMGLALAREVILSGGIIGGGLVGVQNGSASIPPAHFSPTIESCQTPFPPPPVATTAQVCRAAHEASLLGAVQRQQQLAAATTTRRLLLALIRDLRPHSPLCLAASSLHAPGICAFQRRWMLAGGGGVSEGEGGGGGVWEVREGSRGSEGIEGGGCGVEHDERGSSGGDVSCARLEQARESARTCDGGGSRREADGAERVGACSGCKARVLPATACCTACCRGCSRECSGARDSRQGSGPFVCVHLIAGHCMQPPCTHVHGMQQHSLSSPLNRLDARYHARYCGNVCPFHTCACHCSSGQHHTPHDTAGLKDAADAAAANASRTGAGAGGVRYDEAAEEEDGDCDDDDDDLTLLVLPGLNLYFDGSSLWPLDVSSCRQGSVMSRVLPRHHTTTQHAGR